MPIIWFILFTPLLGFILPMILGKKNNTLAGWITVGLTGLNLAFSAYFLLQNLHNPQNHLVFDWFSINDKAYKFGFLFDSLTLMMLVLVNFIALLVEIFSLEYMHDEPDQYRYFGFLSLFVFSMLGIVLTDNLFVMYAFWELVGLSSYLLIGFWYKKPEAVQASKKAFLMNRIGDAGFLIGIFAVYFYNNQSLDLTTLSQSQLPTIYCILLFCGCIGKSAQFPLHTWLPDAMEGPTPVSALIHAATMVVAGIYLFIRVQPMFSVDALTIIAGIGAITMLLGSVYAIFQTDIKKTLAYSTVSQLGLMVLGLGTDFSTFHLLTHAFFKAGLFLSAGAIIHALHHAGHDFDAQDMRLMGGLRKRIPFTFICYLVCSMALMGLPLFSGFLSKDGILSLWFDEHNPIIFRQLFLGAILLGIILTAFYMTRQVWMVFFGEFRNENVNPDNIHEGSWKIKMPIGILTIFSTGFVFSLNPLSAEHGWFISFMNSDKIEENHLVAIVSTIFALIGVTTGYLTRNKTFSGLPTFDAFYQKLFVNPTVKLSSYLQIFDQQFVDAIVNFLANLQVHIAKLIGWFDAKIIDGVPNGLAYSSGIVGRITRSAQGGKVQLYIGIAFLGLIGLVLFIVL
ncbi:NADH-quinone oxidoreductase subunit L [Arcicella aurantiaca]|uniref:NADH-quinone oxidoreductase subunit L n=1 Tax=Arcicella aurantiaca TaxID=591202 RepID=A0A316EE24_9BACT|nr:NADH-quinone oxidoreductase subunit L [Arcicella aurantiaca]PWK27882.1 NADH-quinone oxidoreductase subunit L [Arcicella aurantiaca]